MSEHHKTRVFIQDRKDLTSAISTAGLDMPAIISGAATHINAADSELKGVTGSHAENGVNLAMLGQDRLTERLEQTHGVEAGAGLRSPSAW